MFRSSPSSGRVRRLLTSTALLCSVLFAAPAGAQTPTEAPSALPVMVPASVTGLDPLVVIVEGTGVSLRLTDAAENVATWDLDSEPPADPGRYEVDLNLPDEGSAPVNGMATVTLSVADESQLSADILLDRDPVAPAVTAEGAVGQVALTWDAVSGPGTVTYRLERAAADGAWAVLRRATTATSYLDADLAAGRYVYRLTAVAAAAEDGFNLSIPVVVTARAAAAGAPTPTPEPTAEPPSPSPVPQPTAVIPDLPPAPEQRRVAATGDIRGGVEARPDQQRASRRKYAGSNLPALATRLRLPRNALAPRIATPQPLPQAPPTPTVAVPRIQPLPVPVAPAGMLVVEAADGLDASSLQGPVTMVSAALLAALFVLLRRRREEALSLAPDGPR